MHNVLIANKEYLFAVVIKIATGESLTCCELPFRTIERSKRQTKASDPIRIEKSQLENLKIKKPSRRVAPPAPRKQNPPKK